MARRIQRRPFRCIRYARGVTRCTARSILSATWANNSAIAIWVESLLQAPIDAMTVPGGIPSCRIAHSHARARCPARAEAQLNDEARMTNDEGNPNDET